MPKRVTFNPRVQVRQGDKDVSSVELNGPVADLAIQSKSDTYLAGLSTDSDIMTAASVTVGIALVVGLAVLATWIAGLVKMGMCGGASSAYFWATLLLFILVPGPGSIAGFIMAIVALAVLRPGKTTLGMTCPAKK